jgi:hypothetical protein
MTAAIAFVVGLVVGLFVGSHPTPARDRNRQAGPTCPPPAAPQPFVHLNRPPTEVYYRRD